MRERVQHQYAARVRCSFRLVADGLTPDQISAHLELKRDGGMVLSEADCDRFVDLKSFASTWWMRSTLDHASRPQEHVTNIVERLEARKNQLLSLLRDRALADISVAIVTDTREGHFNLSPSLAARIANLGVELKVWFATDDCLDSVTVESDGGN